MDSNNNQRQDNATIEGGLATVADDGLVDALACKRYKTTQLVIALSCAVVTSVATCIVVMALGLYRGVGIGNMFTISVEGLCQSSTYIFTSVYTIVVASFVPAMHLFTINYKLICTDQERIVLYKKVTHASTVLMIITLVAIEVNSGWIALLCYSLKDGFIMVFFNRPIGKPFPRSKYFGTVVLHHIVVLGFLAFVESGVYDICKHSKAVAIVQTYRNILRFIFALLFYSNKEWKNPMISLVVNVLVFVVEIGCAVTLVWIVGPMVLVAQVLLIGLDYHLMLNLHRQRKQLIEGMQNETNKNDEKAAERRNMNLSIDTDLTVAYDKA